MKVHDAEDDDGPGLDAIEDAVREPVHNRAPRFSVKHLVLEWVLGYPVQRRIHLGDELAPQPGTLQFVPARGQAHIGRRSSTNKEAVRHSLRRISSRACSQGSASSGFASCSSIR